MVTMTIRMADQKHARLRRLAAQQGISLNKLVDEWASMAIAQFDAETRFRSRAGSGDVRQGLALLDKLDSSEASRRRSKKRRTARRAHPT